MNRKGRWKKERRKYDWYEKSKVVCREILGFGEEMMK